MINPKKRIVVVDDDDDHLLIAKLLLESNGYDVLLLRNCHRLVQQIIAYQPSLILMDHSMPFLDGISATKLIRKDQQCEHIPVIYFTAVDDIERLAGLAGADDFISKPFKIETMLSMVRKYA